VTVSVPCGTVQEIPDSHRVWRAGRDDEDQRVWFGDERRWIPAPKPPPAIQFNPDLSVAWREHLELVHDLGPAAVLPDGYTLVWEAQVGAVRALGVTVEHSPPEPDPWLCAHSSVDLPDGATKAVERAVRTKISQIMRHVHGTLPPTGPPGG
jgi:hypothetical protein